MPWCQPQSHLEVGWVDPHRVGVLLAELQQALGQVVNLAHSDRDTSHHLFSMGLDGGGAVTDIRPVGEVDLSLGINGEHPMGTELQTFNKLCWISCWGVSKTCFSF